MDDRMNYNRTDHLEPGRSLALALLLLLGVGCAVDASEMQIRPEVMGVWHYADTQQPPSFAWRSQWIWMNGDIDSDMMLARRSFELPKTPEKARLRITATSQYQLFVNGEYVCRGPARCVPHHQSFDALEIARLLRKGKNTLAVRVHYQRGIVSYHHGGRAGLLAQLDVPSGGKELSLATDSSWKVHPDTSWDNEAPHMSRFHLEVCDWVDMRRQIRGWAEVAFDDTRWPTAKPLFRHVGWPGPARNSRPRALTPPWTSLVLRDIPYVRETETQAIDLIEAAPIANDERISGKLDGDHKSIPTLDAILLSKRVDTRIAGGLHDYQESSKPLVIPASDSSEGWFLLFDFGAVISGRPRLDIEGPAGAIVDIMCTPYILNDRFTARIVDSELIDRVVLSGRRDVWEACYFKPTRYLAVAIRSGEEPIKLHAAGIREIAYPFAEKGRLRAPDAPWFEHCWRAAAKTIRACTTDAYTDNYRERRQYAQTGYYGALGNYWVFGDTALQRRYLRQVAQEQEANGMMPAYAPLTGDDFMIILDSNCLWVRGLRNYLLYSGHRQTTRELLPAARKLMHLLHSYTNSLGLLDGPPYAYWLDHARNDRRGANFCLNGHYLGALEDFAQVLGWLNEPGAELFQARADRLRQSLRARFWDPQRRLFSDALDDGRLSNMFSEHANAMALAMNVATREQAEAIAEQLISRDQHDFIRRESGITMVTPAMSYFLHAGLCRYGYVEDSLRMFRQRFDRMLQPGTNGTLWEEWWLDGTGRNGVLAKGRTRSDAQTESAFPPALFAEYLLGIRPTQPGLAEVVLFRSPSGLRRVEGAFPSPEGTFVVRWDFDEDGGGELDVEVPGAMQVKVDLASLGVPAGRRVVVDGRRLEPASEAAPYLALSNGSHSVQF
jgi:hypothetical protein